MLHCSVSMIVRYFKMLTQRLLHAFRFRFRLIYCLHCSCRYQYTTATGQRRAPEDVDRALPPGWVWTGPWSIDAKAPFTSEGWDYDVDFHFFSSKTRKPSPSPSAFHFVRQRRLVRERRKLDDAPTDTPALAGIRGNHCEIFVVFQARIFDT